MAREGGVEETERKRELCFNAWSVGIAAAPAAVEDRPAKRSKVREVVWCVCVSLSVPE